MSSLRQRLLATAAALPLAVGLTSIVAMLESGGTTLIQAVKAACNPCAASKNAANPCKAAENPCAAKKAPCNPCAAEKSACNPCQPTAAKACNPCAADKSPCQPEAAAKAPCNPCAAKKPEATTTAAGNPCSALNPCAGAVPSVTNTMPVDKIIAALREPPKQSVGKIYTLEEITKSFEVQKLMRSVEVNSVAFDFDSADVKDMQAEYLANIGAAIKKILKDSPEEVFFIGGHADAPGTEAYNQKLSNKRALQVKNALVNIFGIPAKNIMAGGFGEKHLKIQTDRPEQANRRVTVRCITPLVKTAETTN